MLSRPWCTAQPWRSCFGMSSPHGPSYSGRSPRGTHTPAHSTTATPRTGTLAKVLEKHGRHHQWSVLSGRQTHSLCPESRNFSKPAIIMPSWRKPADPTLVGRQPSPDPSQALWRVPRRPAAFRVPQGQGMCLTQLGHCKSPDSAGNQWVWTHSCPGFLPNSHFPTPSFFSFKCKVSPDCTPAS